MPVLCLVRRARKARVVLVLCGCLLGFLAAISNVLEGGTRADRINATIFGCGTLVSCIVFNKTIYRRRGERDQGQNSQSGSEVDGGGDHDGGKEDVG